MNDEEPGNMCHATVSDLKKIGREIQRWDGTVGRWIDGAQNRGSFP
jgi:hypothetical protein